jgi:thioredoxin reductase (NADPH)
MSAKPDIRVTRRDQMFPVLTAAQIARLMPHGRRMRIQPGQVLVETGQRARDMLVVLSGSLEVLRPGIDGNELIVVH